MENQLTKYDEYNAPMVWFDRRLHHTLSISSHSSNLTYSQPLTLTDKENKKYLTQRECLVQQNGSGMSASCTAGPPSAAGGIILPRVRLTSAVCHLP